MLEVPSFILDRISRLALMFVTTKNTVNIYGIS